jgi:hypothetical protein
MLVVDFLIENSQPFVCRLEDGVVFSSGQTMLIFHADTLMRLVSEIIYRVVESALYNYCISNHLHFLKLRCKEMATIHPLD